MAKINDLKKKYDITIPVVEFLQIFSAQEKTKYLELLCRLNDNCNDDTDYENYRDEISRKFDVSIDSLFNFSALQCFLLYKLLDNHRNDMLPFPSFCDYNERGLILNKDVQTYKSFDDINDAVNKAKLKIEEKELEKQVIKVFEDDEWLLVRPLTYQSSLKYGAHTQWCTASSFQSESFTEYTENGILIYIIHKSSNVKFAAHRDLEVESHNTSFYNSEDYSYDSMDLDIPSEIIVKVKEEFKIRPQTNAHYREELYDDAESEDEVNDFEVNDQDEENGRNKFYTDYGYSPDALEYLKWLQYKPTPQKNEFSNG